MLLKPAWVSTEQTAWIPSSEGSVCLYFYPFQKDRGDICLEI